MKNKNELHYMDIETGEILTRDQAWDRYFNEYDGGDPSNLFDFWDYFDWVE